MLRILTILHLVLITFNGFTQQKKIKFTIEGVILDRRTNKIISGATITINNTKCSTGSNNAGLFTLPCEEDIPPKGMTASVSARYYERVPSVSVGVGQHYPIYLDVKMHTLSGELIDSLGYPIRNANVSLDGKIMDVTTEGKFIAKFPENSESLRLECSAAGYKDEVRMINQTDSKIQIRFSKIENAPITRQPQTRKDSTENARTRLRDIDLVHSFLGQACCYPYSEYYHRLLVTLRGRLFEFYSTQYAVYDPQNPLQSELQNIIMTLARRMQQYDCEDDVLVTVDIIRWLHHNSYAREIFKEYDDLYRVLNKDLTMDLKSLRQVLGILLLEGFKKTYRTKSYEQLPPRYRNPRRAEFVNYKNRAKVFEFIMAVSTNETLKSNMYQAQSELIGQGKMKLPLRKIKVSNWQFKSDQEHWVVHYFPTRREALKTASANSPIQCKILTLDSDAYQKMSKEVIRLRFRLDAYIAILEVYTNDLAFDGYRSFDPSLESYASLLAEMPCSLTSGGENCSFQSAFTWRDEK